MADLIARIRGMIADPSGTAHFTDEQIEGALDRRRREVVELPLSPVQSRTALGAVEYLRWVADRAPWETGAVVLNSSKIPIAAAAMTEDEMDGIWTFPVHQDSVYVTGLSFDLYGTAADLLDQWIAEGVSAGGAITEWETDGQKVKRAGADVVDMVNRAKLYRGQALPVIGAFGRSDIASGDEMWALRP